MPLSTKPLPTIGIPEAFSFWENLPILASDKCWPWMGSKDSKGYGRLFFKEGRRYVKAHRIAYFLGTKTDPYPLQIIHTCDNPPCCNPNHLLVGTSLENNRDCRDKRRNRSGTAKVNRQIAETIRKLYASGDYYARELAIKFNVSREIVAHIVSGETWSDEGTLPVKRPPIRRRH